MAKILTFPTSVDAGTEDRQEVLDVLRQIQDPREGVYVCGFAGVAWLSDGTMMTSCAGAFPALTTIGALEALKQQLLEAKEDMP